MQCASLLGMGGDNLPRPRFASRMLHCVTTYRPHVLCVYHMSYERNFRYHRFTEQRIMNHRLHRCPSTIASTSNLIITTKCLIWLQIKTCCICTTGHLLVKRFSLRVHRLIMGSTSHAAGSCNRNTGFAAEAATEFPALFQPCHSEPD